MRIVRLQNKHDGVIRSYPTVAKLVRENGVKTLGICLNALYNALARNDGTWENSKYHVFYDDVNLTLTELR